MEPAQTPRNPTTAVDTDLASRFQRRLTAAAIITAAWLVVTLAWTPPTYLVQRVPGNHVSLSSVFLFVLANFVPWMAATPVILHAARRFPVTDKWVLRHLMLQIGVGVVLLPLITISGLLLGTWLIPGRYGTVANALSSATITMLYAVPTYIAVAVIGQALVYLERYKTRERLLAHAELRALVAQLNPHFLFNVLNSISELGYKDPVLADRALNQLGELLRLTLYDQPQETTLRDEIGFIRKYLDLYAIIMPGKMSVEWSIETSTWNLPIPTMMLQPLVENAIVHGLMKLLDGGRLSIATNMIADRVRLTITNDAPSESSMSGTGIGLTNVRERLRAHYGDAGHLSLEQTPRCARVTVELPRRGLPR
jgi:Histidine kinase